MKGSAALTLTFLNGRYAVCKLNGWPDESTIASLPGRLVFFARTDQEISLVCEERAVPAGCLSVETGWAALRLEGPLDFSLTGVLAPIASRLAEEQIPIFAVSTYDTDYLLLRQKNRERTKATLSEAGYSIRDEQELV